MKTSQLAIIVFGFVAFMAVLATADYYENKPPDTPVNVVNKIAVEVIDSIFAEDSVIYKPIKVKYTYLQADFPPTTDTTYWFFTAWTYDTEGKNRINQTKAIEMPFPYFNFIYAADWLNKRNPAKNAQIFIQDFKQIPESGYKSYYGYARKY